MKNYLTLVLSVFLSMQPFLAHGQSAFDIYKKKKGQQFQKYSEQKKKEFDAYRRQRNLEFAKYLEQPWHERKIEEPVKPPIKKELPPIIYDEKKDTVRKDQEIKADVVPTPAPQPQPEPVVPIIENKETETYRSFIFYGTEMKVRWGDADKYKLSGTNEKAFAKAYKDLTATKYNNLLNDCLELRKNYSLCDWAYYKMLESLAMTACGKGSNEAVFLQGLLFQQSGYMIRFATNTSDGSLHLLIRMEGNVYNCPYYSYDGKVYYLFDGSKAKNLKVTEYGQSKEMAMSLDIPHLPKLDVALSTAKTIMADAYDFKVSSRINKNLIDFFNDYPTSMRDGDFMTRWAYYANTPISNEVKELVYPALKKWIAGVPPVNAANMLLNWVQPPFFTRELPTGTQSGFPYQVDNTVWGTDRAFFAEETLYYPFSDCEDHAILFSHLVRDLLGLDVVLVFYNGNPSHLSTAICFDGEVPGDYLNVGNRRFVVADPTYSRAPVGRTMNQYRGIASNNIKAIVCKR